MRCQGTVRKELGLSFDGEAFNFEIVIGDLEVLGLDTGVPIQICGELC